MILSGIKIQNYIYQLFWEKYCRTSNQFIKYALNNMTVDWIDWMSKDACLTKKGSNHFFISSDVDFMWRITHWCCTITTTTWYIYNINVFALIQTDRINYLLHFCLLSSSIIIICINRSFQCLSVLARVCNHTTVNAKQLYSNAVTSSKPMNNKNNSNIINNNKKLTLALFYQYIV